MPTTRPPLSNQLASFFDKAVRSRGTVYFRRGLVREIEANDVCVIARVQGTCEYDVALNYDASLARLDACCTCPYASDRGNPCKHLWALILHAESRGVLADAGNADEIAIDGHDDDEAFDDDDPDDDHAALIEVVAGPSLPRSRRATRRSPDWRQMLSTIHWTMDRRPDAPQTELQIRYTADVSSTQAEDGRLVMIVSRHRRLKNGNWSKRATDRIRLDEIEHLPDAMDRGILALLNGAGPTESYYGYGYGHSYGYREFIESRYDLAITLQQALIPMMARTGRLHLLLEGPDEDDTSPVTWDDGPPLELWLDVRSHDGGFRVTGSLRRTGADGTNEVVSLDEPQLLTTGGLVYRDDVVSRLEDFGAFAWIAALQDHGRIDIPAAHAGDLLETLYSMPRLPRLDLPETLSVETVDAAPICHLKVRTPKSYERSPRSTLPCALRFDYRGRLVDALETRPLLFDPVERHLVRRNAEAEHAAAVLLAETGVRVRTTYREGDEQYQLAPKQLPAVARTLTEAGWVVEADGRRIRGASEQHVRIKSGIDWFDLHGDVSFGDQTASLPELLQAVRSGEDSVLLDDGSHGLLPEAWLRQFGGLAGLGSVEDDHVRFRANQVGLLDAMLASRPEVDIDAGFRRARKALQGFRGVRPAAPPRTFRGKLRGYQREGLGWFGFLEKFGFGGCLADDMGLGKTVQVLALLESRRRKRAALDAGEQDPGPSLVVVPRSLIFNWIDEAARFTPRLRVLDHSGLQRVRAADHFNDYDMVLTTYGTLRRDVTFLKDVHFDYAILDESQAIKNAATQSAKAARLLQASHRLALSGTPIENHLGELWSLMEFLNPGMLGTTAGFDRAGIGTANGDGGDDQGRRVLAEAVRPFILRRLKEQVATELPARVEQTIMCDLLPKQRRQYDELRAHYRRSLLQRVDASGMGRTKMHVLEALLRLRQASCHPGLVDNARAGEPAAKLEVLIPRLLEIAEEGHKALVFSQFTSLLKIVRERLDAELDRRGHDFEYEYLDGRTRKRAPRVERFQSVPDCRLFLISLKAGGLGLNLTAAGYVFLLDPWWNPAVEAQAIDRSHRIGQTRQVMACRLIARDTVEERVLELQEGKRELADAIIGADNSVIKGLTREDLERLLS